jgi:hypothetical protein
MAQQRWRSTSDLVPTCPLRAERFANAGIEIQYESTDIDDSYADDFDRRKSLSGKPDLPGYGSEKTGRVLCF